MRLTKTHDRPCSPLGQCDPTLDVSIIIVNWNTRELLDACLTSVAQSVGPVRAEIIVVDNGSSDGSAAMVGDVFPNVRLVINTCNVGFAAANNQGLRVAHGRYLLLLNSDTIVLAGAIDQMVRYMDTHAGVGGLGPRLLNEDRSLQVSVFPFPHIARDALVILEVNRWPLVGALTRRYARRRNERMSMETGEVQWVMGSCLLLRRQALVEVGLLDEGYYFTNEEIDLCYRLRQRGWSIVHLVSATIIHLGGRSSAGISAARLVWRYTGPLRYYRLHHDGWQYLVLRIAIAAAAVGHMTVLLLQRPQLSASRSLLSAYARVLRQAYHGDPTV